MQKNIKYRIKKLFLQNKTILFIVIFSLTLLLEVSGYKVTQKFLFTENVAEKGSYSLQYYADKLIDKCKSSTYRTSCYDYALPSLMDPPSNLSMEDSFEVIKLIQKKDDTYWYCHDAAHKLSAKEYDRNPNNWTQIMTRCELGICANGCLHGSLQKHFSSETFNDSELQEITTLLNTICEKRNNWQPTNGQRSICYHELGHLTLYITNLNFDKAATICDTISIKKDENFLDSCYEGMFMQVFEPREPEDFSLIYPIIPLKDAIKNCDQYSLGTDKGACWEAGWKNKSTEFCNQFKPGLKDACLREAWVVNTDVLQSPEKIDSYCSYTDDKNLKRSCLNKLFISVFTKLQFDSDQMKQFCLKMPNDEISQCFANTAVRMISTDKSLADRAVSFCIFAQQDNHGDECFQELIDSMKFYFSQNNTEYLNFCKSLPNEWKNTCY